jgi:hypothetical protein
MLKALRLTAMIPDSRKIYLIEVGTHRAVKTGRTQLISIRRMDAGEEGVEGFVRVGLPVRSYCTRFRVVTSGLCYLRTFIFDVFEHICLAGWSVRSSECDLGKWVRLFRADVN